jgi:RNA polymerase sigma-70 factor (ECF subfamily)
MQQDERMADAFAEGDEDAVRTVYARHAGTLLAVATAALRDPGLAEECVQEAFLRAWRAAPSFDPARPLGPWLVTIARRVAIDIYRREACRPRAGDGLPGREPAEPAVDLARLERSATVGRVRAALDRLAPEERAVVRLVHLDGRTHREAAARLGVPVGTVKSRAHRACRRLASLLAGPTG